MQSLSSIRQLFLDFFAKNGHTVVPSSSLVPHNDPTLMFTNAGMNQFKNVFTGAEKRKYVRAASSQKCVRAGGKHNDLDNVGYTARHHTFFEMLGNFSFGDYFKELAIELAWNLITKEFGLLPEKLVVTVYHTDDEAFNIWKKISGFPDSRILRIPTNDNFWAMGDTGPCGPCSEIFYDHGAEIPGGPPGSPDADGDRFIEIWNLVFMQYEQVDKDTRNNLPKPSIDTGMGLERLTAVLQGVHDNYDIDLFKSLIAAIDREQRATNAEGRISQRVIADHLRSSCFLLADGVMPSNEGRGYVLRRIMRRAMRHAHQLGAKDPLMHKLVPALIHEMGEQYPELSRAQPLITETLKLEEQRFKQTLERGLKLLEEEMSHITAPSPQPSSQRGEGGERHARAGEGGVLGGDVAFKLYDTYGFPLDLTEDILRGKGLKVDVAAFEAAMQEQKDRARAAWSGSGEKATSRIWFEVKYRVGAMEFLGYAQDTVAAELVAIVVDGKEVDEAVPGTEAMLVFNQTPFYGESGGQIGDTGWVKVGEKIVASIDDTQKPVESLHVHTAEIKAPLKVGEIFTLEINTDWRNRTRANHSATHLLHAALRRTLGGHVTQKGSLVEPGKLRFDFSHPKAMTEEELDKVEYEVNRLIWQNTPVETKLMTPNEAVKKGAMALFGEKYGDEVRVLSMGIDDSTPYSVELCGGTHVRATGDIGLFKILSEAAVAAGIRRIEAATQAGAFFLQSMEGKRLRKIALEFKTNPEDILAKLTAVIAERKKLEKELGEVKKSLAMGGSGGNAEVKPETIGSITFIAKQFDGLDPKELRGVADSYLQQADVVAVTTNMEGKISVVVGVNTAKAADQSAVPLVQAAVAALGGKGGGGRPEMAQGGGPDASKLEEAIAAIRAKLG